MFGNRVEFSFIFFLNFDAVDANTLKKTNAHGITTKHIWNTHTHININILSTCYGNVEWEHFVVKKKKWKKRWKQTDKRELI